MTPDQCAALMRLMHYGAFAYQEGQADFGTVAEAMIERMTTEEIAIWTGELNAIVERTK